MLVKNTLVHKIDIKTLLPHKVFPAFGSISLIFEAKIGHFLDKVFGSINNPFDNPKKVREEK